MTTASFEPSTAPLSLSDLPDELLALVLGSAVLEPSDAARVARVSRRLHRVSRQAPLRLQLHERTGDPAPQGEETQRGVQARLHSLCRCFPGAVELLLGDLPVDDDDVALAVRCLPALAVLQLNGCKKLTPGSLVALSRGPALRTILMQRCFQMRADALTQMLAAAASPSARLSCLALSHLSLAEWAPPCGGAGTLRMLALHNCARLTAPGLRAIVTAGPALEALCLGGCSLSLAEAPKPGTQEDGAWDSARQQLRAASQVLMPGPQCSGTYACWLRDTAVELAVAASRLPRLRVVEVTFCAPGLAALLRAVLGALRGLRPPELQLQVWDLCGEDSVVQAKAWCSWMQRRPADCAAAGQLLPSQAASLVQAAVRCSSAARQTPLHAAAEDGSAARVDLLLGLGAEVAARDRSGATPLFAACEAGHAEAAARLLAAGADATQRNSAGEAPLYIAALRGHEEVVDVLLAYCAAAGIDWQQPRLYGDAWTPLHAAAVGGRAAVVGRLLAAAGGAAADLVCVANRYGQTALHVAARKGSPALLQVLLDAANAASLAAADCDGRTAAEVARRNGNGHAWRMLQAWQGRLEQVRMKGTTPKVEKPRRPPQGQGQWVGRRLQQRKQSTARPA